MPGILALDQAILTGWAFALPGDQPVWGQSRMGRASEGASLDEIGSAFWIFLLAQMDRFRPSYIRYERPYVPAFGTATKSRVPMNPATLQILLGLKMLIVTAANLHGIDCAEVSSASFTLHLTGSGRHPSRKEKKLATIRACWLQGWKCTEDEADALAILMYAESQLYPEAAYRRSRVMKPIEGPLFATRDVP